MACEGENLKYEAVVRLHAPGFCSVKTRFVVSTFTLRCLTETERRIAETENLISRTDRLLDVIGQQMIFAPRNRTSKTPFLR
jgi:hypothetical protein